MTYHDVKYLVWSSMFCFVALQLTTTASEIYFNYVVRLWRHMKPIRVDVTVWSLLLVPACQAARLLPPDKGQVVPPRRRSLLVLVSLLLHQVHPSSAWTQWLLWRLHLFLLLHHVLNPPVARSQCWATLLLLMSENPRAGWESWTAELTSKVLDITVHAQRVLLQTVAGLESKFALRAWVRPHPGVVHQVPANNLCLQDNKAAPSNFPFRELSKYTKRRHNSGLLDVHPAIATVAECWKSVHAKNPELSTANF